MDASLKYFKGYGTFSGEFLCAFHIREIIGMGRSFCDGALVNGVGAHEVYKIYQISSSFTFHKSANWRRSHIFGALIYGQLLLGL